MGDIDRIVEFKTSLDGRVQAFDCTVAARGPGHVTIRYQMVRDHDLHGVPLRAGEWTFGYFWFDRPYNLYHWVRRDGSTAAHYFNIGSVTAYDGTTLRWRDDAVDVLWTPDGNIQVLDEDEIPDDLAEDARAAILAARDLVLLELHRVVAEAEVSSARLFATMPDLQAGGALGQAVD